MADPAALVAAGEARWPNNSIDIANTDAQEVTDYLDYCRASYAHYSHLNEELWQQYVLDFGNFMPETFDLAHINKLRPIRTALREGGVWIPSGARETKEETIQNLIACANLPETPSGTLQQLRDLRTPRPRILQLQLEEAERAEAAALRAASVPPAQPATAPSSVGVPEDQRSLATPEGGRFRTQETEPTDYPYARNVSLAQSEAKGAVNLEGTPTRHRAYDVGVTEPIKPTVRTYGRELGNLAKLYTEDLKYGNEVDNFDFKLTIFKDNCGRADVPPEQWLRAYPTMLRGLALDHYYTNVAKSGLNELSFEEVCNATRAYFEGEEFRRGALSRWNSVTFRSIMEKHPEKAPEECLQLLVTELRHLQHSLEPTLRTDPFLHNKLILACQDVPACEYACYRPSETLAGLINDLRSSIITRSKQLASSNTTEQMFTDRRYHSNRPAYRQPNRPANRTVGQPAKRCFVCKQEGCWSTKHTKEEQEDSKQRFRASLEPRFSRTFDRNPRQYMAEFEGEEPGDAEESLTGVVEALIAADTDDFEYIEPAEAFLTSFGPIGATDASNITSSLAERSFVHALTADSNPSLAESDPFAYLTTDRYTQDAFYGVMIDSGASKRSTAGYGQYLAYIRSNPASKLDPTTAGAIHVQFGIGSTPSIGSITIPTPIGAAEFHVVKADTPFLLCLADMDALGVYLNNLTNELVGATGTVPVVRRFGHAFMLWDQSLYAYVTQSIELNTCYLTSIELQRLHRRFGHPSVDRLRRILERTGHEVPKHALIRLSKYCTQCQLYGKSPGRFKFTLKDEEIDFNHSIYIDIMHIDNRPVLHVIDEATRYQAARWLKEQTSKHIWNVLRMCWIDTYIGPPDRIVHDAGRNLTGKEFAGYARGMNIVTKTAPVEAHNSVGLIERSHPVLRRAYQVLSAEFNALGLETNREMLLQMAVKAVNDTAGPDGLIPTLLVYGTYPRMVETDPPAPSISQRAAAIRKAMAEITKIRAKRQVADALNTRNGPDTTDIQATPLNEEVLIWRENARPGEPGKRVPGWTGPRRLLGVTDETCRIQQPSGQTDFRTTVVRPFHRDPAYDQEVQDALADPGQDQDQDLIESSEATDSDAEDADAGRAARLLNEAIRRPNMTFIVEEPLLLTTPANPRQPFVESRQKELNGLLEKGVFEIVNITDIPEGSRIFNSRFVDELKNIGTAEAFEKSRLVVQAYMDQGKGSVLTESPTLQRVSQRVILALAAMLLKPQTGLFLRDITQAYTQATTRLNRVFYIRPPPEIGFPPGTILRVIKPLYGIPESGNHWYGTYHKHHTEKLNMATSTFDPCLLHTTGDDFGLVGLQTDDTLILADASFATAEETKLQEAGFTSKDRERLTASHPLKFNGGNIRLEGETLVLSQERQCANIQLVGGHIKDLKGARGKVRRAVPPKDQYVAQRARGAYVATVTQPEAAFDLSFAAQVTGEPTADDVKRLNRRLQWQIDHPGRGLHFVKLDRESLRLVVFTDASFANNKDLSSQIGYVIALADGTNMANIVHWSSTKCKRVTRSVLASELYAMAHGFDIGAAIKATIEAIMRIKLPLVLCTDSKSLYDCLVKLGTTQEKRLMVDLMCLRQAYERREIAEVRWIDGNSNPADSMTKEKPCQALAALIDSNTLNIDTTEWVERPGEATKDEYKGLEGAERQLEGLED